MNEKLGIVKWFNAGKGYGFIISEGKEYFVHFREIKAEGYKSLEEKQTVNFTPGNGDKGLVAKNVCPVDE